MDVEKTVKYILSELSGEKDIKNDYMLQEKLLLDSLAMVTMLIEIEDSLDIELDESDMNPFKLDTVQSVIDMVLKYCGDKDE